MCEHLNNTLCQITIMKPILISIVSSLFTITYVKRTNPLQPVTRTVMFICVRLFPLNS